MNETHAGFVCPATHKPLEFLHESQDAFLSCAESGKRYPIRDDIPDLTYPEQLPEEDQRARSFYDDRAEAYDRHLHLTFHTHGEDEDECRREFISALELDARSRVLDLACGTGRDAALIAAQLGPQGELYLQDISPHMLKRCVSRLNNANPRTQFCLGNACYLPYVDNFFDAVYSFGGLGEFSDVRRSLAEMVRVTRTGGKIVVGDESIPPWLRKTEFAKILTTTNPQFAAALPLDDMPIEARDVRLRWVIGNVFYLIDFRVGEGEPEADFDFPIPGARGGTYRTRYEGQLEGVTKDAKLMAYQACRTAGLSMHDWLDRVVRQAAENQLQKDNSGVKSTE